MLADCPLEFVGDREVHATALERVAPPPRARTLTLADAGARSAGTGVAAASLAAAALADAAAADLHALCAIFLDETSSAWFCGSTPPARRRVHVPALCLSAARPMRR